MIKKVISKSKAHLSLAIIILGAVCFLTANVLLKEILSHEDYGQYSIVITYLSVMYLFGLLGLEQIFIRYSHYAGKNAISTQQFQVKLIAKVILVSSVAGTIFFKFYFFRIVDIHFVLLYFATLSIVALLYLFNIFRLNSDFIFAQLLSNFWKIILFPIAALLFIYRVNDLNLLLNLLMGAVLFTFLFAIYFALKKITFVYNKDVSGKLLLATSLQFFIAISAFSLIMFGDRFVIESKFGVAEFGNYFYLTNLFLAPFSILQNYVGFKQLVFFKSNFSVPIFNSFNKKILIFGFLLGAALLLLPKALTFINIVNFNFSNYNYVIILMVLLGIVRLYSASINSAFEAKTNISSLQRSNIIFIIVSFVIIMIALLFFTSLESVIAAMILIWLIKSALQKRLLLRQVEKESQINHSGI